MNFFKWMFGRRKRQVNSQRLLLLLRHFITAGTWDASRRVIEAHPELLSSEAITIMGQIIEFARQESDEDVLDVFNEHLVLLHRCQEVGVTQAFAEKTVGGPSVPRPFAETIRQATKVEDRFSRGGDVAALNEAITLWEHILDDPLFPSATKGFRLAVWNNAAVTFMRRFQAYGELHDLTKAIALWQESISLGGEGSPDWGSWQTNLGIALVLRFEALGEMADLDATITAHHKAMKVVQEGSPDWARGETNLGIALVTRFEALSQVADLDDAIASYHKALNVTRKGSLDWAGRQTNLGVALSRRFEALGQVADLDAAIAAHHKALDAAREGSPDRASIQANLGGAFVLRFEAVGSVVDLDAAIAAYHKALDMAREGFPSWARWQTNLGMTLNTRFEALGRVADLDAAIVACEKALAVVRDGSHDWASMQANLGVALRTRFEALGQVVDLDAAIDSYHKALKVAREGSPDWARIQANLGGAFVFRFEAVGWMTDLDDAINAYHKALSVTQVGSPTWASMQSDLGVALRTRFEALGGRIDTLGAVLRALYRPQSQVADLDDAIAAHHGALEVTRERSPDWARWQTHLGEAFRVRFIALGRVVDLDAAIGAYEKALDVFSPEVYPDYSLTAALPLGRLLFYRNGEDDLEKSLSVYKLARRSDAYLYFESLYQRRRQRQLRSTQGMFANYAYALAHQGKLIEAVEVMETGRARELAEMMQGERILDQVQEPEQRNRVKQLWRRVMEAQSVYRNSEDKEQLVAEKQLAQSRRDYYALMREIHTFFEPMTPADIQVVARSTPLVYLLATPAGGLALIVHDGDVAQVWLADLTEAKLREAVVGPADDPKLGSYLGAYDRWRRKSDNKATRKAWFATIESITRWLWDVAMERVVLKLHELGYQQAVLIPGGWLGLLPLHAAWIEDDSKPTGKRYALDEVLFTYTPSARSYRHVQKKANRPANTILAIDNPDQSLWFSSYETDSACSHFPSENKHLLSGSEAQKATVLEFLGRYDVLHFSTHAYAGWNNPLQGGLTLADGATLTVAELLSQRFTQARLVVLSACETAVPGLDLPDEVTGLPTAFVQAGVPGVVGSLWLVNDVSTMMLMARFYDLWREQRLAPAAALRIAQQWLRDTNNAEKQAYFELAIPELLTQEQPALSGERMSSKAATIAFLRVLFAEPEERSFAAPYHWAAFSYTGV